MKPDNSPAAQGPGAQNPEQPATKPRKKIITPENLDTLELDIFPDTGHHFKFIPFSKQFLAEYDPERMLTRLCNSDRNPWSPYHDGEKDVPWIRWRLGRKQREVGLWIAVETNTGDVTRGCFLEEREVAECPENPMDWYRSPYAYVRPSDLTDLTTEEGTYDIFIRIPSPTSNNEVLTVAKLQIVWKNKQGVMNVDLVVDFGNTRTIVLAMEDTRTGPQATVFSAIRPILFQRRGEEYPVLSTLTPQDVIADSWVLMQEPIFYSFDVPSLHGEKSLFKPSCEYWQENIGPRPEGMLQETLNNVFTHVQNALGNQTQTVRNMVRKRIPQMFVEVSPVIMGTEAKETLASINLDDGLNLTLSSPKRYLWDTGRIELEQNPQPWNMNPNRWSTKYRKDHAPTLSGQICRFMYSGDGCKPWKIDQPPYEDPEESNRPSWAPDQPRYARCNVMSWAALSILENAYRQINSDAWKQGNLPFVQRRIHSISVTFPSGWISGELEAYRKAWNRAADIFTLAHFKNKENIDARGDDPKNPRTQGRPRVHVSLDEAVASQLPFIYSEITRLGGEADPWIELYGGKKADGKSCVRVMTVDIGGGTTDTSVVEYINTNQMGANLIYNVMFRDCSSVAGDEVVYEIIQSVLLPSMLAARGALRPKTEGNGYEMLDEDVCNKFREVVASERVSPADRAKWQRITRLVFIPIVTQWLTDVATIQPHGYYKNQDGQEFRTVGQMIEESGVDEESLNQFNSYLSIHRLGQNFVQLDDRLEYNPDRIRRCIHNKLINAIAPLAKYVAAYEVDVITLSGKISEMPTVAKLLRDLMPIMPNRIVRMKDFYAGPWYPQFMSKNCRIGDAKSVTAVGAAIYSASINNHLSLKLTADQASRNKIKNYWGPMSANGKTRGFSGNAVYLESNETTNAHKKFTSFDGKEYSGSPIGIGAYIGRQKFKSRSSRPEPQYRLVWNSDSPQPQGTLAIVLERVEGDDDDITMVSIEPTSPYDTMSMAPISLELCTMIGTGFWMESCLFTPNYSDNDIEYT